MGFLWAFDGFFLAILKLADIFGGSIGSVFAEPTMLKSYLIQVRTGQVILAQVIAGITIAICSQFLRERTGIRILTLFVVIALLPPALSGHSGSSSQHQLAITRWAIHIVSVSLWVAGILALVILVTIQSSEIYLVAQKFSPLALICFTGVVVSGLVNAALRINSLNEIFSSRYGLIIFFKTLIFLLLGGFGAYFRTSVLNSNRVREIGNLNLFTKLVGIELFLMCLAIMLGVLLSHTKFPNPHGL